MKKLLFVLLILPSLVFAAVPNVFVSGDVATAEGFNQNFTDVDTRLTDLENKPAPAVDKCPAYTSTSPISYIASDRTVGESVTINGKSYKIVKMPFADIVTGDIYNITFPARGNWPDLSVIGTAKPMEYCRDLDVDGYPAVVTVTMENYMHLDRNADEAYNDHSVRATIDIYFGNQKMEFSIVVIESGDVVDTTDGVYDISDQIIPTFFYKGIVETYLDRFIDYIRIEKVEAP